jgi:hypothetical protein
MDITSIILFLMGIFAAWWIINTFFTEPIKTPAFVIMGVILLIILLVEFFPSVANFRIGH